MLISLALVTLILLFFVVSYNNLVKLSFLKSEAWSGIEVQLKRRHDLVPNLVSIVKAYAKHENDTFEDVTRLRAASLEQHEVKAKAEIEKSLGADVRKLLALVEAYPDLKADKNFRQLQADLVAVEDDLQDSRRYYNGTVRNYNTAVQSFPTNLIAAQVGFKIADFFELEFATERSNPNIDL